MIIKQYPQKKTTQRQTEKVGQAKNCERGGTLYTACDSNERANVFDNTNNYYYTIKRPILYVLTYCWCLAMQKILLHERRDRTVYSTILIVPSFF